MNLKSVPEDLLARLRDDSVFGKEYGDPTDFSFVGGGCINSAGVLKTTETNLFIKWNNSTLYPGMFEAEKFGLELLFNQSTLEVPEVISTVKGSIHSGLIMEFIDKGAPVAGFWENFGEGLAQLHRNTQSGFGLEIPNYIGSLPQINTPKDTWAEFFAECRIMPMMKRAFDLGWLAKPYVKKAEEFCSRIDELFPKVTPSLLHGDLWSGNFLISGSGNAAIVDPAVNYGHRESEIAFTQMFGGFDQEFYSSYWESFPTESGFYQRAELYNLYPLLVHVNLFGGGYVREAQTILSRF